MLHLSFFPVAVVAVVLNFCFSYSGLAAVAEEDCHYETWDWDLAQKKAVNVQRVWKKRSLLSAEERGTVKGCTVCEEDQVEVKFDRMQPFKICKVYQAKVERVLAKVRADFPVFSVTGYRVGKSKGPVNSRGLRTQFSNHSYGTALDFNAKFNGLYDTCREFGPHCRLVRGGPYRPLSGVAGSITANSSLYLALREEGFLWGGEIRGTQKDFMHFSLNGM